MKADKQVLAALNELDHLSASLVMEMDERNGKYCGRGVGGDFAFPVSSWHPSVVLGDCMVMVRRAAERGVILVIGPGEAPGTFMSVAEMPGDGGYKATAPSVPLAITKALTGLFNDLQKKGKACQAN